MALAGNLVLAQPIPTNEWISFFSANNTPTLDGSPIPVGAVVDAYDPDGIWCGTFTVHTQGQYGFLLVYRDDSGTPDVDEGASPGDTITFYINGHYAIPLGPGDPVWTANGDIIQLNLEGHSNYDPTITSIADTSATEDQLYSYTVIATDIDGDTLTYSLTIQPTWLSIDSVTGVISGTPTNDDVGDTVVLVKVEDGQGGQDSQTYTLHVSKINDPPVISDFPDSVTFRSDTTHIINLNDYVEDVDDPDLSLHWSVTGNDSVSVTINPSTNIAELSASLTFSGKDTLVFTVNDDSSAWDSDTLLIQVIPYIRTVTIPLNAGWNLVSWDVDTPNDSVGVLLSDIMANVVVVLSFEAGGLTYDPDWPQFSNLQLMDHLHGYWIKIVAAYTLYVTGATVENNTPIVMEAGWNLVSYLPDHPDSVAHALESILDNVIVVLGFDEGGLTYDPDWPQFSNLQIMYPTYGYWIRVTESCTLIYPDTQVVSGTAMAKVSASGSFESEVTPTNEWINVLGDKVLFDGELLKIGIMVQAKDPDGIICGEYLVNREGCFGMMPVYRDDPTSEVDEGADVGDEIKIYVDGIEVDETITWGTFGEVYQVGLTPLNKALPMSYGLSQNFPNPFNPVTQIKYHLPESGQVTLTIFNVLGQRVKILVDGLNEAGYYTVYWDGRDDRSKEVTSGVYFYRMKAGRFTNTRKMIILK